MLPGCAQVSKSSDANPRLTYNIEKPQNEEDFIAFSLEADRRLLAVHNVNSPSVLEQYNIKPVKIKTKKDLEKYLSPYWSKDFIEKKWNEGSKNMPEQSFGFEKKDTGFLSASDVKFARSSDAKVIVSGKVCSPIDPSTFRIRYMIIEKTRDGWKATSVRYRDLEKELELQLGKTINNNK